MKIDCGKTLKALNRMSSALGNEFKQVNLKLRDGSLLLSAGSPAMQLEITVENCSGSEQFAVSVESLKALLGNRSQLKAKLKDSKLRFANKAYKGELLVLPYAPVEVVPATGEGIVKVLHNSGVSKHFNTARSALALTNVLTGEKDTPLCVKVSGGTMYALSYDSQHVALYRAELADSADLDLRFNLKDATLRSILKLVDKSDRYDMQIGGGLVYLQAEDVRASITTEQIKAAELDTYIKVLDNNLANITATATVDGDHISTIVGNMMAIVDSNTHITLEVVQGGLNLDYRTTYGHIEEKLALEKAKIKGRGSVKLSPTTMVDVVGVWPSGDLSVHICTVKVGTTDSKRVIFQAGEVMYGMTVLG